MSAPDRVFAQVSDWQGGSNYMLATSKAEYHSGYGHKPDPVEYIRKAALPVEEIREVLVDAPSTLTDNKPLLARILAVLEGNDE